MRPRPARAVYDGDLRVIDIPRHNQNAHDRETRACYMYIAKIVDKTWLFVFSFSTIPFDRQIYTTLTFIYNIKNPSCCEQFIVEKLILLQYFSSTLYTRFSLRVCPKTVDFVGKMSKFVKCIN